MRISFHNLGCKVNSYETESMESLLAAEGIEIVAFDEPADVCVINTCSVTNIADRKSRQMIHKARKLNPGAIIVACGCYAQMFKEDLEAEGCADIIIGNNRKGEIVNLIKEYKDTCLTSVSDLSKGCEYEDLWLTQTGDKTRAFIKIEDGCNNFCTYCIIPYARGRVRSRNLDDIVKETENLAEAGYKEIVLTGINLSAWNGGCLIDVLEAVSKVEGIRRVRISSLEPVIITEDFLERLVKLPKVCPHFHLSLQSGCDSVLERMNRHYTTTDYLEKCRLIRNYYDHPAITTDVIVGFPGET
ncbi:MAG: MiaB/RimO family radical SAM methylthiotransferase, partial [Lachnospiraceae bacterium]|nr:MiaB/RimO family radical SAM methylthiotransferase [Lachnospiraceae bacterium]